MTNFPQPNLHFVVLHHTGIADPHFDLLIETSPGSELAAWRSPVWPIVSTTQLTRLQNHRRIYLEYEGDLSGNRGRVSRIAGGNCRVHLREDSVWIIELSSGPSIALTPSHADQWIGSDGNMPDI